MDEKHAFTQAANHVMSVIGYHDYDFQSKVLLRLSLMAMTRNGADAIKNDLNNLLKKYKIKPKYIEIKDGHCPDCASSLKLKDNEKFYCRVCFLTKDE